MSTGCEASIVEMLERALLEARAQRDEAQKKLAAVKRLGLTCPLIEEKWKNENYILYVCECSTSNPARRVDCPFYSTL